MIVAGPFSPRKFLCGLLVFVLLLPTLSFAMTADFELETMLRGFEREIPSDGSSSRVLPGYGYLRFDAKNITSEGLSFHGYGWGRYDMADSNYFDSTSDGELIYGYLEYRKKFSTFHARLGRMHVFEGVANDTLDGLWLAGKISPRVSLSVYGGQAAGLSDTNGRSGDSLYGGRIAFHGDELYDIGVSAKFSKNDGNTADSLVGLDLNLALPKDMSLIGYSKYNTDASSFAEHSWELIIPHEDLTFKPYLQYYDYDSYFDAGAKAANPFHNLASSGETLGILGFDISWRKSEEWNIGTKLKAYRYDNNDSSQYVSAFLTHVGDEHTQTGGEIGYMNGEAAKNNYLLLRLFTFQDQLSDRFWISFVSADALYTLYDEKINGEGSALYLSLGAGKKYWGDALDVKLSADYSDDPFYSSDLRGMLSATFHFGGGQ